jgi:hypothetical protein
MIIQNGIGNFAEQIQQGDTHIAEIDQLGDGNIARQIQVGSLQTSTITQHGNNNFAETFQTTWDGQMATVTQIGDGGWIQVINVNYP